MGDFWLGLVEHILRPARPDLPRSLRERALYLDVRKRAAEQRLRAIGDCEKRIENLRSAVFAASDGVVSGRMTELEREWRKLARLDPDAGVMDLWARIAPPEWVDRKRWRESPPNERADVAVALASDVVGIMDAETAVESLRSALAERGTTVGPRVGWRFFDHDRSHVTALVRETRPTAPSPPSPREDLLAAALTRFPDRPLLARDLATVAAVRTAPAITAALGALWKTGYLLSSWDESGVVLELPPIV